MNTTVKTNKAKGVFIPMEIIENKQLTMNEKAVYAVVAYHTENGNGCFLSANRMAEMLGVSEKTIDRSRKHLHELQYVFPQRKGKYTFYTTNVPTYVPANIPSPDPVEDTDIEDIEQGHESVNVPTNVPVDVPTNVPDEENIVMNEQIDPVKEGQFNSAINKEKLNKEVVLESASSKALQSPAPLQLHSLSWSGLREGWDRFLSSVKEGKAVNADATCSAYLQELGNRGYDGTASKWQDAFRQATVTKKQWSVKQDDTPQEVTDYVLQCMRQGMSVGECEKQLKSNVTEGYRYTPRVHSIYTAHAEGLTSKQRDALDLLPY